MLHSLELFAGAGGLVIGTELAGSNLLQLSSATGGPLYVEQRPFYRF